MYSASAQFHNAVFNNSPVERILFRFADSTIFTNEDIHVGSGVKYMEAANLEEELTIGACPSSSIEATIMNYHGLLSGYAFGDCEVSLAVRTSVSMGDAINASAVTVMRYGTGLAIEICGYLTEPYIKINGHAPTAQPPFPVYSVVTEGEVVYCIGENGEVWAAAWVDGQTWSAMSARTWNDVSTEQWDDIQGVLVPLTDSTVWQELNQTLWDELATTRWSSFIVLPTFNAFMVNKFKGWAAAHRGMSYNSDTLYEFTTTGRIECYEYVKLGKFRMTVPQKKKVKMISTMSYDRMTLFDVDASSFLNALTYPITLGEIFARLCAFVGVNRATISFINSTRSFAEAPAQFEGVTAREVLGWIAEAACSFARMTRDGEVELAWFAAEAVSIPMTQYFSIDAAEYSVAKIDKLQIVSTQNDIGVIIGTGTNGYQIMDNPFLYGSSDQQIRTLGVPIYNRLSAFSAFSPVTATAVCDWSIQAGDIISIDLNGVAYTFPVYCQTITWNGCARVSYESTGTERRPVMDAVNRRVFSQKRAMHEITVSVDGLTSRIEDAEGNVADLQLTAQGLSTRIGNAEGAVSTLAQTATSLSTRITNAEGDIGTLELTAQGLSTRIGNAEGAVTAVSQKVDSITLSVENGTESSTIKLWKNGVSVASPSISFSGMVTFNDLSGEGTTQINGANISTGKVNAAFIDVDNLSVKHLNGADGEFKGTLNAVTGTFEDLIGTGDISLNRVVLNGDGLYLLGDTNDVRLLMNPPTTSSSGGDDARWVWRGDYYCYSLGIASSSIKVKKNIETLSASVCRDIIDKLRPVLFNYIEDDEDAIRTPGFIAEETALVSKEITVFHDNEPSSVKYKNITAILVADMQSVHREIELLRRAAYHLFGGEEKYESYVLSQIAQETEGGFINGTQRSE